MSAESLKEAFGSGGKEGLLKYCLDQAAVATEKKVRVQLDSIRFSSI